MSTAVIQCYVAACASSLIALHHARCALLSGRIERVLVVSAEAALLPIFISSYQRLGVLACLTPDGYRGLPLDANRNGFMLAEMGAAVLLEKRATPGAIELVNTAVAAEANDMVRPSKDMAALHHIASQLLDKQNIDLLHPHATGTADHDPVELGVYDRCDAHINDIYASKGAIGHGLGTAGLASLVIACMCAKANRRPPMPWLKNPIDANIQADAPPDMSLHTQAIFAAGFAGHVAGAVIKSTTD
jgi:3-oxoacyl-(acyl-carrier-protein) synthase